VLLVVGVIAAGVFWLSRNKDTLIARGKAVVTEGKDAGRKTDNQCCIDQSIFRYKKAPGFANSIEASVFMQTCLQHSRPTPGFCDGVPKQAELPGHLRQSRKQGSGDGGRGVTHPGTVLLCSFFHVDGQ
jgi:hypothetical protein